MAAPKGRGARSILYTGYVVISFGMATIAYTLTLSRGILRQEDHCPKLDTPILHKSSLQLVVVYCPDTDSGRSTKLSMGILHHMVYRLT